MAVNKVEVKASIKELKSDLKATEKLARDSVKAVTKSESRIEWLNKRIAAAEAKLAA